MELEEVAQDAEVLVVGAARAFAPVSVKGLLQPLGADRRLQVDQFEVGEVAGELVEATLRDMNHASGRSSGTADLVLFCAKRSNSTVSPICLVRAAARGGGKEFPSDVRLRVSGV